MILLILWTVSRKVVEMLKDIKVKICNQKNIPALISHAVNLGYTLDESVVKHLTSASNLLFDPNQVIRHCDDRVYDNADSYQEMTFDEFIHYWGDQWKC